MHRALIRAGVAVALVGGGFAAGRVAEVSPAQAAAKAPATGERVFELRTYHTPEGKLPDLDDRFRQHTLRVFQKHGMSNIAYFIPTDSANTLVYLIAHESLDAAKKNWAEFGADPEWQEIARQTQLNGRIVSRVQSIYLRATDYSPIQ